MPAPHASSFRAGRIGRFCAVGLILLLGSRTFPVSAGGPLFVTAQGQPYRWDAAQPVPYTVDRGGLGSRSHATAVAMIQTALQAWQAIPTAGLRFASAEELTSDIAGQNVIAFLNGLEAGDPSPILLDS